MTIKKTLPCSLFILASAAAFAADNTDAVIMDARPCLDIVSPIERLACFEEQANAAQGRGNTSPQQNQPVVSAPRTSTPQPVQSLPQAQPQPESEPAPEVVQGVAQEAESPRSPAPDSFEDNFGLPEEKNNDVKKKANELIARVAEIKQIGLNLVLITLDNGQAWQQMETQRFALEEGDEVRIYSTRWGSSYRLASLSHKGFIQVKRLR